MPQRNTGFLILSDTHAGSWNPRDTPIDVAIHCGGLTEHSKLDEFKHAIRMMTRINADLKLVIAGDDDPALGNTTGIYSKRLVEARVHGISEAAFAKQFGAWGEARRLLLIDAAEAAITFLDEGQALLPPVERRSPRALSQPLHPKHRPPSPRPRLKFHAGRGRPYSIGDDVDVVVTHSPHKGALEQARPRMHCFGHVHEGWGAHLLRCRDDRSSLNVPCAVTAVDYDKYKSYAIESRERLTPLPSDKEETRLQQKAGNKHYDERNFVYWKQPVVPGKETLFVNATVKFSLPGSLRMPWVVDIDLPTVGTAA
ncbi:hypothetical protein GE09DRAFT_1172768 [Coniochaeta sp. 2T2.1]|nr:hypothetical protein GE09DRAFT_1172768 [Coniochaeta sp. 2T2.1]